MMFRHGCCCSCWRNVELEFNLFFMYLFLYVASSSIILTNSGVLDRRSRRLLTWSSCSGSVVDWSPVLSLCYTTPCFFMRRPVGEVYALAVPAGYELDCFSLLWWILSSTLSYLAFFSFDCFRRRRRDLEAQRFFRPLAPMYRLPYVGDIGCPLWSLALREEEEFECETLVWIFFSKNSWILSTTNWLWFISESWLFSFIWLWPGWKLPMTYFGVPSEVIRLRTTCVSESSGYLCGSRSTLRKWFASCSY